MFLSPHAAAADRKVLVAAAGQPGQASQPKKKKKQNGGKKLLEGADDALEAAGNVVGGAEGVVRDFVAGNAPVLIISYEGYRKHAAALNGPFRSGGGVGLLVCDEGHRLKAASGSQTMDALSLSPAPTKLLLTGTPVTVAASSINPRNYRLALCALFRAHRGMGRGAVVNPGSNCA
jgi:hypothetical protein